ncbi:type 4a pilus biogenesis protein PilO [bacterium]|nr:type 4a pilus biogenesis protein PilO [bacterium]
MKINPRDKKLLIFMGVIVILAASYYFLYMPLSQRWKEVNKKLAKMEDKLKEAQTAARMQEKLERDYFEAQVRLKFAKGRLPKEEGLPKLLKDVYKMGRDSGVTILSFGPGALQPKEYYKVKPISLSLKCNLPQLVKFLYNVEKSERLLDVQSINICSDAKGDLGVSLQLATFVYME